MELQWEQNREQLERQIRWQQVRNDFYGNMCYEAKNAAAHERAMAHKNPDAVSYEKHQRQCEERQEECLTARQFYNQTVLPHDQKIKQAGRDGNAELHRQLLDEANAIIKDMWNHCNLALSYDAI